MSARDDAALGGLLGAYALDALEPPELAEVEAALERRPELAAEAARLVRAAAWLGAAQAIEAPGPLRAELLSRARARRPALDGAARTYLASTARLGETFDGLEPEHYETPTPNGLAARDLVVHLAAQESMLAQVVGRPVVPDVVETEIDARTTMFVEQYRSASLHEVVEIWRRSVEEVAVWAADPATREESVRWIGLGMPRDNFLVARAFENWIHRDDLRRVQGRPLDPPVADDLHEMADLSLGTLPFALLVTDHARPGKIARVVLTGAGGGEWLLSMGGARPAADAAPDVTFTTDIVDWCLVAGERLDPGGLVAVVEGDRLLAEDLVAAAPAFATL
jgi:uncharacterized protein (TIGR03083 family)